MPPSAEEAAEAAEAERELAALDAAMTAPAPPSEGLSGACVRMGKCWLAACFIHVFVRTFSKHPCRHACACKFMVKIPFLLCARVCAHLYARRSQGQDINLFRAFDRACCDCVCCCCMGVECASG